MYLPSVFSSTMSPVFSMPASTLSSCPLGASFALSKMPIALPPLRGIDQFPFYSGFRKVYTARLSQNARLWLRHTVQMTVVLVGPTAAGKSTLAAALGGRGGG